MLTRYGQQRRTIMGYMEILSVADFLSGTTWLFIGLTFLFNNLAWYFYSLYAAEKAWRIGRYGTPPKPPKVPVIEPAGSKSNLT